ncbi:MAG: acetyl-CoA carboxylase biotin carboxyl carrier protein [Candidatus Paracaedibacteraceae bacterium]|nr:acetyl-CoA carboxylase biotin carboxyl carrier protein [Candidatus Paracaedibacteraceae bacterium]
MTNIHFNGDAVRKLAEILVETDLTEIEYEENGHRIYVSRRPATVAHVAPPQHHAPALHITPTQASEVVAPEKTDFHKNPGALKSPMVGTAYLSPEPGSATFVKVGDVVAVGQTLLIVEAMKVMNPIKATRAGKITHMLVTDTMPVEYDQPLLVIE